MWSDWSALWSAAAMSDMPTEGLMTCQAGIDMLFAADLQWDRFVDAAGSKPSASPPSKWTVEAHFFLVAADNAYDRLTVCAKTVRDAELASVVKRLRIDGVKQFRHHQEHLEERMPGGRRQDEARLSAPGNDMIRIEGGGSVFSMNNLVDGRILTFGNRRVDLAAVHSTIIAVSVDLLRWLVARSRFRELRSDPPAQGPGEGS